MVWNSESKTVMDSLTWGDKLKRDHSFTTKFMFGQILLHLFLILFENHNEAAERKNKTVCFKRVKGN